MNFSNYEIFPTLRLKHGTTKTIDDPFQITGNGNREIRRKTNLVERYQWNIPSRNLYQEDLQDLIEFYGRVGTQSFLFRDHTEPEYDNLKLTQIDTARTVWGIYGSGLHPLINFNGPAWNPASAAVVEVLNLTTGAITAAPAITWLHNTKPSTVAGVLSLAGGYARSTLLQFATAIPVGSVPIFSGAIYRTARFNSPLSYTITAMEKSDITTGVCEVVPTVSQISDIQLTEVYETP